MAKTVTAAEMKARERAANEAGLLYIQMMENAGRAAWKELKARVPALKRLLVVAGKGNNGGDGFVIARVAAKEGVRVRVLLAEGEPKTPDAQTNLALLAETAAEVVHAPEDVRFGADAVVDALYGTGFHGELRPGGAAACALMGRERERGAFVLALDLPSGVSADSGLATFRDSDGTWGNYRIEEVCIPEALDFNRRGVIRFYNERRAEMLKAEPNAAHRAIAGLERDFDVRVITQNVDNLHERAGSTHILHLHGELTKLRSTDDPSLILPFDGVEQGFDDRAPDGSLLRPHIVFFGEPVPEFDRAAELAAGADILMVVGTSLAVYPAASLVRCVRPDIPVYVVDPGRPAIRGVRNPLEVIRKRAAEGVPELADRLRAACAEGRSESLLPGKA